MSGRPEDGLYCGLHPRAWTVYNIPEVGVRLICRQVSPCLPHNYKDSALPAFVFIFSVENNSGKELKVGVTLCFKNGTGSKRDQVWQPLLGASWTVQDSPALMLRPEIFISHHRLSV